MTIPSCEQFSTAAERIARTLAIGLAWLVLAAQVTYEAGLWTGTQVHRLNDWLARDSHAPMAETIRVAVAAVAWADKVTEPAPTTFAQMLAAEGIRPLTDAELDAEIAKFDAAAKPSRKAAPRTTARRKPAGARKAKTAA